MCLLLLFQLVIEQKMANKLRLRPALPQKFVVQLFGGQWETRGGRGEEGHTDRVPEVPSHEFKRMYQ